MYIYIYINTYNYSSSLSLLYFKNFISSQFPTRLNLLFTLFFKSEKKNPYVLDIFLISSNSVLLKF